MHPAWQIDDIRYLIFDGVEPQDLARLARTCKAFFDVTTNKLWRTLNSVSPFLACLPLDFRRRPLQPEDIRRLDFYASKVQNLILESKSMQILIPLPPPFRSKHKQPKNRPDKSWEAVWEEIAKLRPATEFLFNLRRLRISNAVEELLVPLIGISGSNLAEIYIKYIQNRQLERVVPKVLGRLQDTLQLEYLFVRDGEPDLIPLKLIRRSPLKHLRLDPRIHAGRHEDLQWKQFPLRYEILQKSTLEHLTLGLTREWYSSGIKALKTQYFPALKTLWLNLTTFKPEQCEQSCINAIAHSWTCLSDGPQFDFNPDNVTDCGRRSPTVFLKGLDNPELNLLNIKFPLEATGTMFLDVVSAVSKSCRLNKLTELALAGGGWFNNCSECGKRPGPQIRPTDLRGAMNMLLPLSHLRVLRLSVAPNFLDILDLALYKSITDGLPALEKLWLGHAEFAAGSMFEGITFYERVPLRHLAAFCSMLPNLVEISVGAVDGMALEEQPHMEWACPGVKSLAVCHWIGRNTVEGVLTDQLHLGLRTYFPHSNLAKQEFDSSLWTFY